MMILDRSCDVPEFLELFPVDFLVYSKGSEEWMEAEGMAVFVGWRSPQQTSWWKYLIIALLDVEANYVVVKAYQYISFASRQ